MNTQNAIILLKIFLIIFPYTLSAQTLHFSFTTVTDEGSFTPRHVLAVWIEDSKGNFVKTLKLMGEKKKRHLFKWNAKSKGNVVDAFTGATLSSHRPDSIIWNCKDLNQNIIPDGTYNIVIEFADENCRGPNFTLPFIKGNTFQCLVLPDKTYFKNMILVYTPAETNVRN